ncbi:TonB-dependent siderophore receptor [Pseudomonas putida]|uniref:TonB-dependent siderophore receptor n=1 Tax=Pseudomonas putida TaxID=303 RepID=UPI0023644FA0|nr:TonB-dependent receptor [Pseudomonas putida]MDD1989451.1 TonB-dependent receptor [Pseudomonas putida]HDS1793814.1 TonB-dependent receptor [Pseudomonas putida]
MTRPAPLRLAIRQALFCTSLGLATLPLAHATDSASTATRYELVIPAGSLDAALIALSRSTGLNIAFTPGDLAGKYSAGLRGSFSSQQALQQLLVGSGLQAMPQHSGYRLIPASEPLPLGAVALDPTNVTGTANLGEQTENTGSYTTGTISTGGKTPRSLRETPQSVSVMTRQRMDDQHLTSLTQVLDQTTGITVVGGNDSDLSQVSDINVPFDITTGDAGAMPKPRTPPSYYYNPDWNQRKSGAYATFKAQLAEPLHLTLGARYSDYRDNTRTVVPVFNNADTRVKESNRGVITPFGALVLDLNRQWSLYTSYAEIFQPQTAFKSPSSQPLDPIEGETYEFGTKGELLDGRLNLSSALYYTKRLNEAVSTGQGFYSASGEVISKGIDSEISGELAPGWQAMAGYTFNINRQRVAGNAANNGTPMSTQTPKHLFKFFTTYQLPGEFERWKVGLGATIQSDSYKSGFIQRRLPDGGLSQQDPYAFRQAGYAVWNGLVEYRIEEHWTATLNGNNLFDKTYYQTVDASDTGNWYGAPRNYMLTLRGKF